MEIDKPEGKFEKLLRNKSLTLNPVGGCMFASNATLEQFDRRYIELKCWWRMNAFAAFSKSISVGDHKNLLAGSEFENSAVAVPTAWDLKDCPIMLTILPVGEAWAAAEVDSENPVLGQVSFHLPIQTSDGVVNENRPTVSMWIVMGSQNFDLIGQSLMAGNIKDLVLSVSIEFPIGAVDTGYTGSNIKWDGKNSLPITEAKVAWKFDDWNSEFDQKESANQANDQKIDIQQQDVSFFELNKILDSKINTLVIPLWSSVVLLLILLIFSR